MRRFICIIFLFVMAFPVWAQYPGQIDNTFGDLGRVVFQIPDGSTSVKSLKKSNDGKIYICGGLDGSNQSGGYIARYTYDGAPDNTFNNGTNYISFKFGGNQSTELVDMAILSDGKILVVGSVFVSYNESHPAAARFLPNGTPDPAFGYNGDIIYYQVNGSAYALALLYNNQFVIAGSVYSYSSTDMMLMGCLSSGSLNTNFGNNGLQILDLNNGSGDYPGDITFFNSRILVSSVAHTFSYDAIVLTAFTENGQPDATFGTDGKVIFDGLTILDNFLVGPATRHTLDATGKIWVASSFIGISRTSSMLLRFLPNGLPDLSFGEYGMRLYDFGTDSDSWFADIGVEVDGKIVVAGIWKSLGFNKTLFARMLSNGDLDPTVGSNNAGYVLHSMATGGLLGDYAYRLMFPWIDKVIFSGWCDTQNDFAVYLCRIHLGINVGKEDLSKTSSPQIHFNGKYIEISIPNQESIEFIGLYDLNGKLLKGILKGEEILMTGKTSFTLEENLRQGMYLLNVVTKTSSYSYKLFIP